MTGHTATAQVDRELAYRVGDGVEVVLLWSAATGDVTVRVSDTRTGSHFEVAAEPAHALDVFEHPYAYALAERS